MERLIAGSNAITWDPASRVANLKLARDRTGPQAAAVLSALAGWIGVDGQPFALVVDGTEASGSFPDWRAAWADFLTDHKGDAVMAVFGADPVVEVSSGMFERGLGMKAKVFPAEEDALSWLRDLGFST